MMELSETLHLCSFNGRTFVQEFFKTTDLEKKQKKIVEKNTKSLKIDKTKTYSQTLGFFIRHLFVMVSDVSHLSFLTHATATLHRGPGLSPDPYEPKSLSEEENSFRGILSLGYTT